MDSRKRIKLKRVYSSFHFGWIKSSSATAQDSATRIPQLFGRIPQLGFRNWDSETRIPQLGFPN